MSEKKFKDRVLDSTVKDRKEIDDWMYGPGGKVLGAILALLHIWTVVRKLWSR
ncbi:hypothetical protein ABFP37_18545 [Burkholderia sp. RS01]|uniref:hypothetical protein n=1 Tax=unclassified Burkholderia TaxID=2613784 RepID=UPI0032181374